MRPGNPASRRGVRSARNTFLWVCFALLAGCGKHGIKKPPVVGGDLPVAAKSSVALPGATNAADAPRAPSVAESRDANVTRYQDPATGVSFRYPTVWRPASGNTLPVPEFSQIAGQPRISQQLSPESTVYAHTVLRALTFSYAVVSGSNQVACASVPKKLALNATATRTVLYGGIPFREAVGGDAAMCTQVRSQLDSSLREGRCLVFERDFITGCPLVKNGAQPRPLTPSETAELQAQLDAIMDSVRLQ